MRAVFIALALMLLAAPAAGAEVYRCKTESGAIRYSDKPCPGTQSEKLDIESRPTDRDAVQARSEARQERIDSLNESAEEAAEAKANAAEEQAKREQDCARARERLQQLTIARRVTTGEGEERRYLEDAEIIERRQQAQDEVNKLCGK